MNDKKPLSQMTDEEIKQKFADHKCPGEECELCHEYMVRFNPDRLVDVLFDEAFDVDEILLMESRGTIS